MKHLFLYCFFVGIFVLASCSNEDFVLSSDETNQVTKEDMHPKNIYSFLYNGKKYNIEYQIIDSVMVLLNNESSSEWKHLDTDSTVITYLHSNGIIEYFDNQQSLDKYLLDKKRLDNICSRATRLFGRATMQYWKGYHDDKSQFFEIPDRGLNNHECNSLTGTGFNDRISSLDVIADFSAPLANYDAMYACFFSDIEFSGYRFMITVDADMKTHIENDLSYHRMTPSGQTWDNVISSWKFGLNAFN